jgi:hypothetical protein
VLKCSVKERLNQFGLEKKIDVEVTKSIKSA